MPQSGYPTPDMPDGDIEYICIPIIVPNIPEFAAAIYGLYGTMAKDYFWREFGTMTPEFAAEIASYGLGQTIAYGECGGTMSCDDVVDCIETNEETILALHQMLTNAGFSPSGNSSSINGATNVTMTDTSKSENLLPEGFACDDPQLMATARQVVLELHAAVNDFFEAVEFNTNTVEAANILTDGIPVAGTVNNISEFLDWMIETITESYNAAYNQEVEDTLACDIFCLMRVDCELTYNMLIDVYEPYAEGEFGTLPSNTNDFQSIVDWATGISMGISLGTVAAMHLILLYAMKFGSGTVFEMAGLTSLKQIVAMSVGYQDMSYVDCECVDEPTPTTYWAWYADYRQGTFGTTPIGSTYAANTMWTSEGYQVNPAIAAGVTVSSWRMNDLGAQYVIKAAASRSLRRGSIGNGTNDVASTTFFPNANCAGTPTNGFGQSFVTDNTNAALLGDISAAATGVYRSWQHVARTSGDPNEPSYAGKVKTYEHVIWGVAGAGNTKPPGAVWVGSVLPDNDDIAGLFPPFPYP